MAISRNIIVWRYSYASCIIEKAKNSDDKKKILNYYLRDTSTLETLKGFDFSQLPKDYDSDSYDLIFDNKNNFIKASKELYKEGKNE